MQHQQVQPSGRRQFVERLVAIDPRSLALFRIAMAVVILADLMMRATDLRAFYSDDGMLTIAMARSYHVNQWNWSLHYLNGSLGFQAMLFGAAAFFAVLLLVGWKTRLATIASWVFACSIHARNPMACNYGDLVLRLFLFWSMFAPLGRAWSLDARRRPPSDAAGPIASVGTASLLVQLSLLYFFAGLYKLNGDWFSGDAVQFAFLLDYCGRPFGLFLADFPLLLRVLTLATLWLELLGPFAVWSPWQTTRFRYAMILAFIGMHVGIEMCITTGILSAACIAAWSLFLPSAFWESRFVRRLLPARPERQPTAKQAVFGRPSPVGATGGFARVGRLVSSGLCLFFLLYVVAWNIASFDGERNGVLMPDRLKWIGYATNVRQIWDMFYIPSRENDWYVARGELADGRVVDVLREGGAIDIAKPREAWAAVPNFRWRFFLRRLSFAENAEFRPHVVRFLFERWNRRHGPQEQLVSLDLQHFTHNNQQHGAGFISTSFGTVRSSSGEGLDHLVRKLQSLERGASTLP